MSILQIKQYLSWLLVVGLALGLVFYGYTLNSNQRLLRVAVSQTDDTSGELFEQLQHELGLAAGYRLVAVKTKNSLESQDKLLKGQADLAILSPAVLGQPLGVRALAPLSTLTLFVVANQREVLAREQLAREQLSSEGIASGFSIFDLDPAQTVSGDNDTDEKLFLNRLFADVNQSHWLDQSHSLPLESIRSSRQISSGMTVVSKLDKNLRRLLKVGAYRLLSVPAPALAMSSPYWEMEMVPTSVFMDLPLGTSNQSIETVKTFNMVAATEALPNQVAVEVADILSSPSALLSLAPYGVEEVLGMQGYSLYPKHSAVERARDTNLASRYLGNLMAFLADYGYLLLLVLAFMGLVMWRIGSHRQYISSQKQNRAKYTIDALIQEVQKIDGQITSVHDMRQLRSMYEQLLAIRGRGTRLMMSQDGFSQTSSYLFNEQCQFALTRIEQRLGMLHQVVPSVSKPVRSDTTANIKSPNAAVNTIKRVS